MRDAHVYIAAVATAAAVCKYQLNAACIIGVAGINNYNKVMRRVLPMLLSGGVWSCDVFPINLV